MCSIPSPFPGGGQMRAHHHLIIGTVIVLLCYSQLLLPLADPGLRFSYGDFKTLFGDDSGSMRKDLSLFTFNNGAASTDTNRFFLIGMFSTLSDVIPFSDTQFTSAIILVVLVLGCYGLFLLVNFLDPKKHGSAWVIIILPFYFLNLWSVERIAHIWIWFTYAILPLFMYLGLSYIRNGHPKKFLLYCLTFAFFGFIPHSFIYMMIVHMLVLAYGFIMRHEIRGLAIFAILPFLLYVLLNMPAFLLAGAMDISLPNTATGNSLNMLSRNAELINLFAMSNNWWQQVPSEKIFSNLPYRYSSIALFTLVMAVFTISYRKMERSSQALSLLCLGATLALIFFAQGMKNFMIPPLVDMLDEADKLQFLAPFREWARLSIMLPLLMSVILVTGTQKLKHKKAVIGIAGVLLIINFAAGPAPHYLNDLFSPVHFPDYYYEVDKRIIGEHKVIWNLPDRSRPILGMGRLSWNTNKTAGSREAGIGEIYGGGLKLSRALWHKEAPQVLLDALNIKYVIKRNDTNEGRFLGSNYDWLVCDEIDNLTLCINDNAPGPFTIYRGTVKTNGSIGEVFAFTHLGISDIALSSNDSRSEYFITNSTKADDNNMWPLYIFSGGSPKGGLTVIRHSLNISGGNFSLIIKGEGSSFAFIGNKSFSFLSNISGMAKSQSFSLDPGKQNLIIYSDEDVDAIWLLRKNDTMIMDKGRKPSSIRGYSRENPTLWKVNVSASGPFLLGFAETYNHNWQASIYKDGKRIKDIRPIMIYEAINGFWIDESGELEIEIRFMPQEAYESGFIITFITLGACLAYLVFGVRR
jgi:hypothetical protein